MLHRFAIPLALFALAGCGSDGDDGDQGPAGPPGPSGSPGVELQLLGRYQHVDDMGAVIFDEGAAEIPAFDPISQRLIVVNALRGGVDVLDASDVTTPTLVQFVDVAALVEAAQSLADGSLGNVNSVSIHGGVAAIAIESDPETGNGYVAFLNCASLALLGSVQVGALPDMVTFTSDGTKVLTADEGQPSDLYTVNPPGSISIIDVTGGFAAPTVAMAGFTDWDTGGARVGEVASLVAGGLRVNTVTGATVLFSQDMEPEYIAVSDDGTTAYATLQENNAIAEIDLATATVTSIFPLGLKDHGIPGNEADVGERDVDGSSGAGGLINIRTWPGVYGCYMPDTIAAYRSGSGAYLVTANEGDAREYPDSDPTFTDVVRAGSAGLAPFTGRLVGLEGNQFLGRLNIVKDLSSSSRLVAFGARSMSIWNASTGALVWDSGSLIERTIAQLHPTHFNASSTNNTRDNRSDDKGPEPEGLTLGVIGERTYAFLGLERIGGIMIFDITNPQNPSYIGYRNDRNFAESPGAGTGGDLAPEGLKFIPAEDSPTGTDLLVVGNEVSGTTVIYEVTDLLAPPSAGG